MIIERFNLGVWLLNFRHWSLQDFDSSNFVSFVPIIAAIGLVILLDLQSLRLRSEETDVSFTL